MRYYHVTGDPVCVVAELAITEHENGWIEKVIAEAEGDDHGEKLQGFRRSAADVGRPGWILTKAEMQATPALLSALAEWNEGADVTFELVELVDMGRNTTQNLADLARQGCVEAAQLLGFGADRTEEVTDWYSCHACDAGCGGNRAKLASV